MWNGSIAGGPRGIANSNPRARGGIRDHASLETGNGLRPNPFDLPARIPRLARATHEPQGMLRAGRAAVSRILDDRGFVRDVYTDGRSPLGAAHRIYGQFLAGAVRVSATDEHEQNGELEGSMSFRRFSPLLVAGLLGFASAAHAQTTWNSVTLTWTTPGDDSLSGTAAQFDLRYSTAPITGANFGSATRWTGMPAPASPGTPQSVTVSGLQPSTTYYFAIKTADEVPNWAGISNVVTKTTQAAPDEVRPAPLVVRVDAVTDTSATLGWNAVGDDSLTGTAFAYDIRYSTSPITGANWASASQVSGEPTPAASGTAQSYVVRGLSRQVTYYFAIRVADESGNLSALSNVPSAITPDTAPPAAIHDLAASFVWVGWHSAGYVRPSSVGVERP
jgi:hypothetical protein